MVQVSSSQRTPAYYTAPPWHGKKRKRSDMTVWLIKAETSQMDLVYSRSEVELFCPEHHQHACTGNRLHFWGVYAEPKLGYAKNNTLKTLNSFCFTWDAVVPDSLYHGKGCNRPAGLSCGCHALPLQTWYGYACLTYLRSLERKQIDFFKFLKGISPLVLQF